MYESAEYSEADKEEGEGEVVIILGDGGSVWGVGYVKTKYTKIFEAKV